MKYLLKTFFYNYAFFCIQNIFKWCISKHWSTLINWNSQNLINMNFLFCSRGQWYKDKLSDFYKISQKSQTSVLCPIFYSLTITPSCDHCAISHAVHLFTTSEFSSVWNVESLAENKIHLSMLFNIAPFLGIQFLKNCYVREQRGK